MTAIKRFTSLTLTLAVAGLLAACGAPAPGASSMSLKAVGAAKAATSKAPAAKATAKAAAVKAPAIALPATTSGIAAGGQAPVAAAAHNAQFAAAGAGDVKVAFGSLPAARQLLGLNDIVSARATLTAANGAVQTQVVLRANFATGCTFTGVAAGAVTLQVAALDAAGAVLGSSAAGGTVSAGQTTAIALQVKVAATVVAAATGTVTAQVGFIEDTTATPSPAVTTTPSPVATLPTFLQSTSPSPVASLPTFLQSTSPSPVAALPTFLQSTSPSPSVAPTVAPTKAPTGLTTDVWGRIYDYAGTQQMAGTVRYKSMDAAVPFEVVVALRDDGYYYIPAVPSGASIEVTVWSNAIGSQAWYIFTSKGTTGAYEWLDVFVQAW